MEQSGWAVGLIAAALVWGGHPALAKQVSWPQSFHDGGHTGFNQKENTLSTGNVAGLQQLWGQSSDNCQTFADALDKGTIYELGQESDCSTWNLQALDAATGAVKWDVPIGNSGGQGTAIAVAQGLVFTACAFRDPEGSLYGAICAYRQADGSLAWQVSNPCNCLPEAGNETQPVYAGGAVYFGYADGGCCGADYAVAADAKTGAVLWTWGNGNALTNGGIPAANNGKVYFVCGPGERICALSQSDGSLLWQTPDLGGFIYAPLVATKNAVYVSNAGNCILMALDPATGATAWSNGTLNCDGQSTVSVSGGDLYYSSPGHQLAALRARNGRLRWTIGSPDTPTGIASVANGVVYAPGGICSGRCTGASAYDAATGALLWNSSFSGDSYGVPPPPIVANGIVYGANDSACGSICAYALPAGIAHRRR